MKHPKPIGPLTTTNNQPAIRERFGRELLFDFEESLSQLRSELLLNLGKIDLLNRKQRTAVRRTLCERIKAAQFQVLRRIGEVADCGFANRPKDIMFKDRLFNPIPLAIGLADGWAAAATARKLVIGTVSKGWIFKTATPLTLAGKVAALLGIPAGVASAFIGILAGIGAFFLARRLLKPLIESFFEKRLLRQFDHEAMPELRRWVKGQIALL